MFVDARTLATGSTLQTNLCIVGAGAAGIALARELGGQGLDVCLLESGGEGYDRRTQGLYRGENVGLPCLPLHLSRLRYFGGATNHWTGWSRALDPSDFEVRDWVAHSGWPFASTELEPCFARAHELCELGTYRYDVEAWETESAPRLPLAGDAFVSKIFQFSPPTLFGSAYREDLERAENVTTLLHANVLELETNPSGDRVARARVATLAGTTFSVEAGSFVLAGGGIENARLLLNSQQGRAGCALGNRHDLVGRYFMEHPYLFGGAFHPAPTTKLALYRKHRAETAHAQGEVLAALAVTPEAARRERILNGAVYFFPRPRHKTARSFGSAGMVAAQRLAGSLGRGDWPETPLRDARELLRGADDVAASALRRAGALLRPAEGYSIRTFLEPEPNPESRVTLSPRRDRLGVPRARLDWKLGALDKRTLLRIHEMLADAVRDSGIGEIETQLDCGETGWPATLTGGSHHMGTTRMHDDPRHGVVDRDCRVHDVANLHVAGSSVFPAAGHVNPTLTLLALALRLADHLKQRIGAGEGER